MKQVIALVGMPGAGKSLVVEYFTQKGIPSVYFGGITLDELKQRGLEVNEVNEKLVREDIRAKEGVGAYAKRIITQIETLIGQEHHTVVADGLYSWSEYKIFRNHFKDSVVFVAVVAPRHLRHERLKNRPTRPLTEAEITAREYAEIENLEKGGPIANADYTIVNDDTPAKLTTDLEKILRQITQINPDK